MKQNLLLLTLILGLLSACTPQTDFPTAYPGYPSADEAVSNIDNPGAPLNAPYSPQPADGDLIRGEAFINSYQLLTLESQPLQFTLEIMGSLPTPCNQLRVVVNKPDASNNILVDVYSVTKPDAICAMMLSDFEVTVPLGSYKPGHYFLLINGQKATEFDS